MEIIDKKESEIDKLGQMIEIGFAEIRQDMKGLENDMGGIKTDLVGIKTDIVGMKADIAEVKADIIGIKTDTSVLKTETVSMRAGIGSLKKEMNLRFDTVDFRLNQLEHNTYQTAKVE